MLQKMVLVFYKLKQAERKRISFFCKLPVKKHGQFLQTQKVQKHEFNFFKAEKTQKRRF